MINEWSGKYSEETPSGTRAPSNCNDGDLSPFTVRIPDVTEGGTDMLFCTLHNRFRAVLGALMREADHRRRLPAGLEVVRELEATMNSLTCRCDPSIPLHLFTVLIGRYTIARLRFSVRANEAFADHVDLASMPGETRGVLLDNALAVLRFDTEMRLTQPIRPFLWHPVARFPFDAFAYLLASLCAGVEGPRHNAAWAAVNSAYEECPEFCSQLDNPLYSAAADLAVGAWERRVAGMEKEAAAVAAAAAAATDEAQGLGCYEMEPPGSTEFSAARHAISALKQARRRRGGEGRAATTSYGTHWDVERGDGDGAGCEDQDEDGDGGDGDEGGDEDNDDSTRRGEGKGPPQLAWAVWQRLLEQAGYMHIGRTYS